MAKNIAVVGDSESIKGFAAVGLDIYPCDDTPDISKLIKNLADSDRYAVIYLTEEVYKKKRSALTSYLTTNSFNN